VSKSSERKVKEREGDAPGGLLGRPGGGTVLGLLGHDGRRGVRGAKEGEEELVGGTRKDSLLCVSRWTDCALR
jgi:hypothetical protein